MGRLTGVEAADAGAVDNCCRSLEALVPQVAGRLGRYPPDLGQVELARLAQSCDKHTLGGDLAEGVDEDHLAALALDIPVVDELGQCAAEDPVNCAGCPAGLLHSLEQVDDDRV